MARDNAQGASPSSLPLANLIDEEIRRRGLTLGDAARQIRRLATAEDGYPFCSKQAVSNWRRGLVTPGPTYRRLIARWSGLPVQRVVEMAEEQELVLRGDADSQGLMLHDAGVDRRTFLGVPVSLGATVMLGSGHTWLDREPWSRLERALDRGTRIDLADMEPLARTTDSLLEQDQSSLPSFVERKALAHLDTLTTVLGSSMSSDARRLACSLAGQTAGHIGWLRWVTNKTDSAGKYFNAGIKAARRAGDASLGVYLMGRASCLPYFREDPHRRLRLLRSIPGGDASAPVQAWLCLLEAEAHGLLGDRNICLATIDRADELMERRRAHDEPQGVWAEWFSARWLTAQKAVCLAQVGHLEPARTMLEPLLAESGLMWSRHRPWLTASLAKVLIRLHDIDRALQIATPAAASSRAYADLELFVGVRAQLPPDVRGPQRFSETLRATAAG